MFLSLKFRNTVNAIDENLSIYGIMALFYFFLLRFLGVAGELLPKARTMTISFSSRGGNRVCK